MLALIKKTIVEVNNRDPDWNEEKVEEVSFEMENKKGLFKNFKEKHPDVHKPDYDENRKKNRKKKKKYDPNDKKDNNVDDNNEIDMEEEMEKFTVIDIEMFAQEVWDIYIYEMRKEIGNEKIDIYEMQMLLDIIGIKKNEIEIKMKLVILAQKYPKEYRSDKYYSNKNYLDVVKSFKAYRIEDKLLVSAFQVMEVNGDGTIDASNLQVINKKYNLGMTSEEINDILNFYNDVPQPKASLSFEQFCNLYYEGGNSNS